jgi:hypothetical protein
MAQASGSLSSASHVVEGVPLSSPAIPHSSIAPTTGASLSPEIGAPAPFPQKRYVLRLSCGLYLNHYNDSGVFTVADLQRCKLFQVRPTSAAQSLHGQVETVFVDRAGNAKRTLLDRDCAVNPPIESRCATDGDNKNLASDTKADASA